MQQTLSYLARWFMEDRQSLPMQIDKVNGESSSVNFGSDHATDNWDILDYDLAYPCEWSGDQRSIHHIGGVPAQLRPVTWLRKLRKFEPSDDLRFIWDGIFYGFPIVDSGVNIPSYDCRNYKSALEGPAHEFISNLFNKEIEENKLIYADVTPTCIHAIGAVLKGNDKFRPITD